MKNWQKQIVAVACAALASTPALALEQGDWLVRVGPTWVIPNDDSGAVKPLGQKGVEVDSSVALGASLTYMITNNLGVEILAATPFSHDVSGSKDLSGLGTIAEVTHLPPTVTLQYYFNVSDVVRPYLGAGINYTAFFDEKLRASPLRDDMGYRKISLDDSFGWAVQAGVDVPLQNGWFVNAAVWYLSIDTTAKITGPGNDTLKVDVDIDPWTVMVGGGKHF
ncbi:hypothetical protein CAI21_19050 [Alkalilimnicola ehrlichii]|uniref:OmpW family protein n=1 Tax=Alkalilimnicola ehrlichii TaxID=351052 RepID=A0A3E0WI20_9GAMM|nr:OmpW family outer membrane protein [Alkalilimnicola ehrlichii]RFA25534.1 hypothetical protein CAI21_19050 [Alkalilimnicola ehrlichii]RFA32612.1 hypothetical protein CAL65_19260 [Alkalilimnicola ehrlichii]